MSNILKILPEWSFTRSRQDDGTMFSFHSSKSCPGYVIQISNWRLRKLPCDSRTQPQSVETLLLSAFTELKRVCGIDVFKDYAQQLVGIVNDKPSGLTGLAGAKDEDDYQKALSEAFLKAIMSPNVAILSVPLITLVMRAKVGYAIDKSPWPDSAPPQSLVHLGKSGFESKYDWGILTIPTSGDEAWIVSKFCETKVETQWDHKTAIIEEFPWINNLNKIMSHIDVMERGNDELRRENKELQRLQTEGFFKFAERITPEDFAAFITIMAKGNRNAAAKELDIPHRSFYDRVNKWQKMGPEYKCMFRILECRKKTSRKIIVPIPDSVLGTRNKNKPENPETIRDMNQSLKDRAAEAKNHSELLLDILAALDDKNPQHWQHMHEELIEIIKDEFPYLRHPQ